jgi:hypothetical protein
MLPQGSNDEKMSHHESQESFVSTVSMDDQMQLLVSEETLRHTFPISRISSHETG